MTKLRRYFGEVVSELKKVTWPTKEEITGSTTVVIVGIAIFSILLGLIDFLVTTFIKKVMK